MKTKRLLDLGAKEFRKYLLRSESYCNKQIPEYFDFSRFLKKIDKFKSGYDITKAANQDTSFVIYENKDGRYSWRKFQLIHPVLYLQLVDLISVNWKEIQDHFKKCETQKIYHCPIYQKHPNHRKVAKQQILKYLDEIEKESIRKSLSYKYVSKLDITDCYPSIYTHSISWAIHSKAVSKNNRSNSYNKDKKPV
jgi:hypothetical protein